MCGQRTPTTTEADERERLICVARSDARWWQTQEAEMLHRFPALQQFAREQAQRCMEIVEALEAQQAAASAATTEASK